MTVMPMARLVPRWSFFDSALTSVLVPPRTAKDPMIAPIIADEGHSHREHQELEVALGAELLRCEPEAEGGQCHRRDNRSRIALEEVGAHAGDVADIVAHVVGDGGRVAGVVLGDARLHLAHQVGAHVGGFGEDAPADPGEQGDGAGAEAEGGEDLERVVSGYPLDEQQVAHGQAQQREARDREAHHRAAPEGQTQGLGRALDGRVGRAGVGHGGHRHAHVTGAGREDRAEDVAEERQGHAGDDRDENRHDQHESGDPGVLLAQEGAGAGLDLLHQSDHALVAGRSCLHVPVIEGCEHEGGQSRRQG